MDEYTPTTAAVRRFYAIVRPRAEFDRWLGDALTTVRNEGYLLGMRHGWEEGFDAGHYTGDEPHECECKTNPYRITEENN